MTQKVKDVLETIEALPKKDREDLLMFILEDEAIEKWAKDVFSKPIEYEELNEREFDLL